MATIREALEIATKHRQAGELQQAESIYRQILNASPNNAEAMHGLGRLAFQSGNLPAAIDLMSRAIAINPEQLGWHINLGNVLQQHGQLDEAVDAYRCALQIEPNFAEVHCNLGSVLNEQGRFAEAVACYRRSLQIKPEYVEAHYNLGNALKEQEKFDEAAACYERARQIDPKHVGAHCNLGLVLHEQEKFDQAVASLRRALQFAPEHLDAHNAVGHALSEQRKVEEALASYQRAVEIDPNAHAGRFHRAVTWLLLGDFEQGWPEYEWRFKAYPRDTSRYTRPRWKGEPLHQRTILLWAEQGFGDALQFVRYAPLVKQQAGQVILHCPQAMEPILSSCPGVDAITTLLDFDYDVHVPLMSLPGLLHTTLDNIPAQIPYLFPNPDLVQKWQRELGPPSGFRIGIAWQGRPMHGPSADRSIPLAEFAPLAQLFQVELISLQKGLGVDQLEEAGFNIRVFDEDFDTESGAFMDTAAVMANLDLVISLDSAPCHLAGAMGVPVWVPLPYLSEWRWLLDRDDSPWYPSMRLFRQHSPADWTAVFQEIVAALRHQLDSTHRLPERPVAQPSE